LNILLLFKGIIIGLSIAAPVGPIGILCIRRTIVGGWSSGLVSGLGAATADGFYGAVAAFGVTYISHILVGQQFWFRLVGGLFLLFLGTKTLLSKPSETAASDKKPNHFGNYFSTLLLTITNPLTILSFAAIFAGFGLSNSAGNYISAVLIVIGVVLGSVFWWFILSGLVNIFRSRFNQNALKLVNWISGSIIILFAVFALVSVIKR
jgi:threonine/homoserine/homoserine lactone efflux protein